jgi:catechol 2,3-dioxygenase-like lactoylglutathione lyase family enzyme
VTKPISRTHVSLRVQDLARSVAFYRAFFGLEPALARSDYAKFEVDDPPLVLSLEPVFHRASDPFDHLGLRVTAVREVDAMRERIVAAGLAAGEREHDVACCYSTQTKFWLLDPDRNLWEIYALTGALDRRGALASSDAVAARDRAGVRDAYEHRLGDPLPSTIPHESGTIDEVRLRGTFNAARDVKAFAALLAEVHRVLRPGGSVLVHGLVASEPVEGALPRLPGPAALVESTPLESEPLAWLAQAGFVDTVIHKLPTTAAFCHGSAQMRELLATGRRAPEAETEGAVAVYRGPFAQATDDLGVSYRRGERTRIDAATFARLRRGPLADSFAFFAPGGTEASRAGAV